MVDLSNKSLAMFLLAVMVISLFGTFMVLNRIGTTNNGLTGLATTGTGIVNLTVSTFMSITTNESSNVDFGACTLNESRAINITSTKQLDTTTYCGSFAQNNISVRNNGNVPVNVTLASDVCAPGGGNVTCTFLNNSVLAVVENGLFQFNTTSAGKLTYTGGCGTPVGMTTINASGTPYIACTNLGSSIPANSFLTDFSIRLPRGLAIGLKTATLTYTAIP
jgi:hypothetical protein